MKKRYGFTLVELLAVIVILGVISLVVFPIINKTLKNAKQKSYDQQMFQLKEVAKKWATEHYTELDKEHVNDTYVPLQMFKDLGYLDQNKIINPLTKEELFGCMVIHYEDNKNGYQYTFQDSSKETKKDVCTVTTKGYLYEYQDGWIKNSDHAILSAIDFVLKHNPLSAVGSGLYEENGVYLFRGADVNNYVSIGTDIWRIVSMDKVARTIKLVRENYAYNSFWDNKTNIEFAGTTDSSGIVTPSTALNQLNTYYESSSSSLNTALNGVPFKNYMTMGSWNVGSIPEGGLSSETIQGLEGKKQVSASLGLLSVSEYMNASLEESCLASSNNSCKLNNYLYNMMASSPSWGGTWTINNNGTDKIWYIKTDGTLGTVVPNSATYSLFPVLVLKNNITMMENGETGVLGSKTNPYRFG